MRPAFGRERAGMSWYASGRGNDERQVQECKGYGLYGDLSFQARLFFNASVPLFGTGH